MAIQDVEIPQARIDAAVADALANTSGVAHPDLAAHDTLGLATQAELDAVGSGVVDVSTDLNALEIVVSGLVDASGVSVLPTSSLPLKPTDSVGSSGTDTQEYANPDHKHPLPDDFAGGVISNLSGVQTEVLQLNDRSGNTVPWMVMEASSGNHLELQYNGTVIGKLNVTGNPADVNDLVDKQYVDNAIDALGTVEHNALDIGARSGLADLILGDKVFVQDASDDSTVSSGWAIYRHLGTGSSGAYGDGDFLKIQEQESLDVAISSAGIGVWAASTAVKDKDLVITPGGALVESTSDRTSGASFDATEAGNWTWKGHQQESVWANGVYYYAGDIIDNNGNSYKRVSPGVAGATFDATEAGNWVLQHQAGINGFMPSTVYTTNELVRQNGSLYSRVATGTSLGNFALDSANWTLQAGNFATTNLTSDATRSHVFDLPFVIGGSGIKQINQDGGGNSISFQVATDTINLAATSGVETSLLQVKGDGDIILNSTNGKITATVLNKDSDGASEIVSRKTADGGLEVVDRDALRVLTGSGVPVDGTTVAYYADQLYLDWDAKQFHRVLTPSTDPDTVGSGSIFEPLEIVGAVTEYNQVFNATTDWTVAHAGSSSGYYGIDIAQGTHSLSGYIRTTLHEDDGTNKFEVVADEVLVDASQNVSVRVSEIPDGRFAGNVHLTI